MSTYVIDSKPFKLESLPKQYKKSQQIMTNITQPSVSQRLARLQRFYKEDLEVDEKKCSEKMQQMMNQHSPSCHYIGNYLAIITHLNIMIWKFTQKEKNSLYHKKVKTITSINPISLYALKINKEAQLGIDILYVTKSPNGIFSIHLNTDQTKMDFNQNIYGAAFLQDNRILFRFQREYWIYNFELDYIKHTEIEFPPQEQPDTLPFADRPTILKAVDNRVFFAYISIARTATSIDYLVILEEFSIEKDNKIKGMQRIIAQTSKTPSVIQNMIIVKQQARKLYTFGKKQYMLKIYILLQNEIIFIKEKKPIKHQINRPVQPLQPNWDNKESQGHFFTVEWSISPPTNKDKIIYGTEDIRPSNILDNVFLLDMQNQQSKVNELMVLHCEYKDNTNGDPSTICIYDIDSFGNEKDNVCNFNYDLKDIIFGDQFGPTNGRIIYCFVFGKRKSIVFILHDPGQPQSIYLMICQTISFQKKMKKLLPTSIAPQKQSDDIISSKRMGLLRRFNEIFSVLPKEDTRSEFFKKIWQKIKELALKEADDNVTSKPPQSKDALNHYCRNRNLFEIIGKNNLNYLYKTELIEYISKEMKQLIEKARKVSIETLRTHYQNIKRISSSQIQEGCKNKQFDRIPLAQYLKSVFYLKKIEEFQNDTETAQKDYKRWKKRQATQYFYMHWGEEKKISAFIGRYYSYFIYNYQQILRQIIQNKTNFQSAKHQSNWISDFNNLLTLLPQYPSEAKLRQSYDKQIAFNKENNSNFFVPIDYFIDFPNISHIRQETTFEDLTSEFMGLPQDQIKEYKESFEKMNMRNNDFLFIKRTELEEREKNLTQKKQAIYIFLELIRDKIANTPISEESSIVFSESEKPQEFNLYWVLNKLKSQRHINNKQFFRLNISLDIYQLAQKEKFQDLPTLSKFLAKDQLQKLGYLLFDRSQKSQEKKIYIFKQICRIWSDNWMAICEPGDRYFRYVLSSNQSEYNIQLDNFNSKQEIDSLIFESVFKRFFMQDSAVMEGKKMQKLKELFGMISSMTQAEQVKLKLLLEFLLESIFQTIFLTQQNEDSLKDIQQLLQKIRFEKDESFYREQYLHQKCEPITDKLRILKLVCLNFHIFKEFNLNLTINNLRHQQEEEQGKKWLQEIQKLQTTIMLDQQTKKYLLWEPDQSQDGQVDCIELQVVQLSDIFELQRKFMLYFNHPQDDEQMHNMLMQNFYEVALEAAYQGNLIQKFKIEQLVEIQNQMTNNMQIQIPNHDQKDIELQDENLLEKTIKIYIQKAKKQSKFDFILQCLQILHKLNNNSSNLYIQIQQSLVYLKKKQFKPQQIQKTKNFYLNLAMKIQSDKNRLQQIQRSYIIEMSQYIDQTINKTFQDRFPFFYQLKILMECFSVSYFQNHQSDYNKPYAPDYLVAKLLIHSANYKRMNEQLKLSDKFYSNPEFSINQKSFQEKQKKQPNQINPDVLKFLIRYFKTTDSNNFVKTIEDNWKIFSVQENSNEQMNSDIKHIELNEQDIKIYSYFPEYVSKIQYYMLGKMFQNQKIVSDDRPSDNPFIGSDNEQRGLNPDDRTFRSNLIFLVRYWKELNFDLDKVILLIKISLNDPYRFQTNKEKNVQEVCLMLTNLLKENKYIYSEYTLEELERICKAQKKDSNGNKKIITYLQQFINRFKQFKSEEYRPPTPRSQNNQLTAQSNLNNPNHQNERTINDKVVDNRKKSHSNVVSYYPDDDEDISQNLQSYFTPNRIEKFIAKVEKQIASGEQKNINKDYQNFNLHRFRIFVTCIKFDKDLTKLFDYEFFFSNEQEDPTLIFTRYLQKNIKKYLKQHNYLKIGKALRYGFDNNILMEFNVTVLFLEIIVKEYKQKNRKQQKREFQKKITSVLDMMDIEVIDKRHQYQIFPILKQHKGSNDSKYGEGDKWANGFMSMYLQERKKDINR